MAEKCQADVTKRLFLRDDRASKERYWNLPMKVKDYQILKKKKKKVHIFIFHKLFAFHDLFCVINQKFL